MNCDGNINKHTHIHQRLVCENTTKIKINQQQNSNKENKDVNILKTDWPGLGIWQKQTGIKNKQKENVRDFFQIMQEKNTSIKLI